jgi:quercetin dioxygenase-like cupin family protein
LKRTRQASLIAGLILSLALLGVVAIVPSLASNHISAQPLGLRSVITDDVRGQIRIKQDGHGTTVVNMKDMSRTVVVKFTVQPLGAFPWHTHAGPVLVNLAQGSLVYVPAESCDEITYTAGEAFWDAGHGHVHSAYNPSTTTETIFYATFLQAPPAPAALSITEGVAQDHCPGVLP